MANYLVAALYKFVGLPDYQQLQEPLRKVCEQNKVCGTLLLAAEGINGTIAGPEAGIQAVLAYLRSDPRLANLDYKLSDAQAQPFYRLKVKLKREIVTMGVPQIDPVTMAGQYIKPEHWNELIAQPGTVVVDVRNDYEVAVGTFQGALNPKTDSFTQFPAWVEEQTRAGLLKKDTPVAMFCTGGIRCEKSTAYMRSQGFENVYHLEGGILKYLETVKPENSRWDGDCFVFDERVTLRHGLEQGDYTLCRACRYPLNADDRASPHYVEGVSCQHCHSKHSDEKKRNLAERQKQIALAQKRKQRHVGQRMQPKPKRRADAAI